MYGPGGWTPSPPPCAVTVGQTLKAKDSQKELHSVHTALYVFAFYFTGIIMAVNLNDNEQSEILQVTIAISVLADIAIVLRLISRKLKGNYALDDVLAVIGLVGFLTTFTFLLSSAALTL